MRRILFEKKSYQLPDDVDKLSEALFKKGKGSIPDKKSAGITARKLSLIAGVKSPLDLVNLTCVGILRFGEDGIPDNQHYSLRITNKRLVFTLNDDEVKIEEAGHRRHGVLGISRN